MGNDQSHTQSTNFHPKGINAATEGTTSPHLIRGSLQSLRNALLSRNPPPPPDENKTTKPFDNVASVLLNATRHSITENLQQHCDETPQQSQSQQPVAIERASKSSTDSSDDTAAPVDAAIIEESVQKLALVSQSRTRTDTFSWLKRIGATVTKRNDSIKNGIDGGKFDDSRKHSSEFYDASLRVGYDRKKPTTEEIVKYINEDNNHNGQIVLLPNNEFWAETANNAGDIHRGNVFFSLLNIDQSAKIYQNEFLNKHHLNFAAEDMMGRKLIISILVEDKADHLYRTIVRTCDKVIPGKIEAWQCEQPMSLEQITRFTLPEISLSSYKLLEGDNVPNKILIYDKRTISSSFKFGILYQKSDQITEEEMYGNVTHSSQMQAFLDFIATPVKLEDHKGYNGGLDTKFGLTGTKSYYTKFEDNEIMFHVSTLLPHSNNDKQQIERKRHIGNDIVTVIFQDPGARFCPSVISSQFLQVFICVQPVNDDSYRVAVAAKREISKFGPFIEGVGYYKKDEMFRKCFFSKLINAQIAACNSSGKIGSMLRRRRHMLFDQLHDELTKISNKSKSALPMNHRSKSVDFTTESMNYAFDRMSSIRQKSSTTFWTKKLSKLHSV